MALGNKRFSGLEIFVMNYDKVIIGAGLYGLYSALYCGKKGEKVLVLEKDDAPFMRATYINQARVHMGYHYPRSLTTAVKSAGYFTRFVRDFDFAIHSSFEQIYATSSQFSWTSASQFKAFCDAAGIKCQEVGVDTYFNDSMCDGAFLTEEYTYDAHILRDFYLDELGKLKNVELVYNVTIENILKCNEVYEVNYHCNGLEDRNSVSTGFLLNATYASVNQILNLINTNNTEFFDLKYELCEIILCEVSENLKNSGITVMDGPFFSIMPFGKTGLHSLTSVTFTPHKTSKDITPSFECQCRNESGCNSNALFNCNECSNRPDSAWPYMSRLASKYLKKEYRFEYVKSLYSMKPILKSSEVDDSRPTAIKVHSNNPTFISVLSGKINTVYDLDEFLELD